MKKILRKNKEIIKYGIFGALTTVINTFIYIFLYNICGMGNLPSNLIAWFLAVIFAFVTNKIWVFESMDFSFTILKRESIKFFGCRIGTCLLDMCIMFIGVDIMEGNSLMYKLFSNIIVIICNYIMSKIFIFNRAY